MLSLDKFPDALCRLREQWIDLTLNIPKDGAVGIGALREVEDFLHGGDARARIGQLESYVELKRVIGVSDKRLSFHDAVLKEDSGGEDLR